MYSKSSEVFEVYFLLSTTLLSSTVPSPYLCRWSPQQSWGGQERSGFGRLGRACSCYFPSSSVSPASMVFFHHSHGSSCHFKVRMVNVRLQSGHFLLDGGYFNYKNPFWWHHVLLKWGHQSALNQTEGSICPSLCPCATVMSSECATLALTMCSKLLRY